jgi:hypothetical protein
MSFLMLRLKNLLGIYTMTTILPSRAQSLPSLPAPVNLRLMLIPPSIPRAKLRRMAFALCRSFLMKRRPIFWQVKKAMFESCFGSWYDLSFSSFLLDSKHFAHQDSFTPISYMQTAPTTLDSNIVHLSPPLFDSIICNEDFGFFLWDTPTGTWLEMLYATEFFCRPGEILCFKKLGVSVCPGLDLIRDYHQVVFEKSVRIFNAIIRNKTLTPI